MSVSLVFSSFIDYKVEAVCLEQPADSYKTATLQMNAGQLSKHMISVYIIHA